ncbi:MAG: hypothetical protein ACQEP8_03755 [Chlamydiota bacterium]
MKKLFLFLAAFAILCSCEKEREPIHIQIADHLSDKFIHDMKEEKNLYLSGYGGGFRGKVNFLTFSFISYEDCSLQEARSLMVECIEELLYRMNHDEELQPYLANYPANINNLRFSISFRDLNTHMHTKNPNNIAYASIIQNNIYYCIYDPSDSTTLGEIHEELYEEAVRIVKNQKEQHKIHTPSEEENVQNEIHNKAI